ncbi:uncharacterized protein LOC135813530 [Sycon ciliatum]|uniref:uncharacterized protein LOC135813530 n=1 Tax=Sycon ciliatum TaxID=27933 RepID=UPI0031F64D42
MPDSVRYNIKYLVSNLDVSLILEDLLENDVLSEEEYVTASGKENEKWDHSKYVVRLMLTKTEEQVDTFLNLIQHSQPHVAEHIASTMANRRKATASGKTDRPTKPMSADRESTRDPSSDNPFDLERFVCDIQPWLNTVDADRLRRMVIKKHLITDSASIEGLKRILSRDGLSDHNEALIQLLRAGGLKTYRDLCVVIEELGYADKSKEMLSILSHTDNPFDLERFVCDIQPWLNTVDADRLRRMVIKKHLITDSASIEGLKRILSRDGPSDHNEKLIQLLKAGGLNTYRDLCVVIEELGYADKSKEMLSILSLTALPTLPGNWEERLDKQGRTYFVDHASKTTTRTRPLPLPTGWEERLDKQGRTYFVDHASETTTRTRPLPSPTEAS